MMSLIQANGVSIAVAAVLLAFVVLIVRRLILDKKAGRHICGGSCGGGCAGCPMHGQCHALRSSAPGDREPQNTP